MNCDAHHIVRPAISDADPAKASGDARAARDRVGDTANRPLRPPALPQPVRGRTGGLPDALRGPQRACHAVVVPTGGRPWTSPPSLSHPLGPGNRSGRSSVTPSEWRQLVRTTSGRDAIGAVRLGLTL
jgi:hypothetical protein